MATAATSEAISPRRLAWTIWLPAGLSGALLVIIAGAFMGLTRRIDADHRFLGEALEPAQQHLTQFRIHFLDELAVGRTYLVTPAEELLAQVREHSQRTHTALDSLRAITTGIGPLVVRQVADLTRRVDEWEAAPLALMSRQVSVQAYRRLLPRQTALANGVIHQAAHVDSTLSLLKQSRTDTLREFERSRLGILASLFPLALVGIVLTSLLARKAALSNRRILRNVEFEALLRDTMAALTGATVLPAALSRIATNAMRLGRANGAFVEQSHDDRLGVEIVTAVGTDAPSPGSRAPFTDSITAELIRTGSRALIVDLAAHWGRLADSLRQQWEHRVGVAVALPNDGNVAGALVLVRRDALDLYGETVARLEDLAAWVALGLKRQRWASQVETEHARLEAVMSEMPVAVVLAEAPSGRVMMFNRHAMELWGSPPVPPEGIKEYSHGRLFHLDGQPYEIRHRPLVRSILDGETVHGEEAVVERMDATRRTVLINTAPIRNASGVIIAGVATITDISQEKRREQAARFLDEISRQLASSLDYDATIEAVMQLMVPRMGDFVSVFHRSDGALIRRMSATSSDERVHRLLRDIDTEYPLPLPSAHPVATAIRTGQAQLRETVDDEQLRDVARDERQLQWLRSVGIQSVMAVPLTVRNRTIGALQIGSLSPSHHFNCHDLSFAEEVGRRVALAVDNAQLLRSVTEAGRVTHFLAESSISLSASLDYDEVLRRVTRLAVPFFADFTFAYTKDEAGVAHLVASAHRDAAKEQLLAEATRLYQPDPKNADSTVVRALKTGLPVLIERVTDELLERQGYSPRVAKMVRALAPVSWMTVPLVARDETIGALLFASTNPERRYTSDDVALGQTIASRVALAMQNAMLYRDVQRALRTRDEVLRIVSHDLRNPLNAIGMGVQLVSDPEVPEEQRRRHLQLISRSRERMERLIQDLRDVSRLEAGEALALEVRPVRLSDLVQESCESFVGSAQQKKVELEWLVSGGIPDVSADRDRIIQVLSNVIGNALKFTPEGGRISVRAVDEHGKALVSVEDTGPGIPREDQNKVFLSFWQAPETAQLGAGLGLRISRGIVEQHGGRIWVESREGEGSKFCFTLPLAESPEEARLSP